jgi:energy-coupling factor transporter ATP-binding protein EcfA2
MNVLMLGHSGVGKTTYVASMYGAMQSEVAGFTIKAKRRGDKARLLELHESILRGEYPAPSNQRESYPFRLCYEGSDVLSFDWADYRGDALVESARESEEARSLHDDLTEADAVLAFFDCTMLATRRGQFREIRRMILLLSRAMQEVDHVMPLALVMAKADLVDASSSGLLAPLDPLLETVRASKHVVGSLIPVACGRDAHNVELPALFALYFGLSQRIERLAEQINTMAAERDRMIGKVSTIWDFAFDWVDSKLSGSQTWGEMAERKHNELLKEYAVFEALRDPAGVLGEYLDSFEEFGVFGGAVANGASI